MRILGYLTWETVLFILRHSNLVAFHYGNLTHPSVDPPRIGFLSTVPANADDLLKQAVLDAENNGGNFEREIVFNPLISIF